MAPSLTPSPEILAPTRLTRAVGALVTLKEAAAIQELWVIYHPSSCLGPAHP